MKRISKIALVVSTAVLLTGATITSAQDISPGYGTIVKTRPEGSKRIRLHGRTFLRTEDEFYVRVKKGYRTIAPPVGAAVSTLPDDAEEVTFEDGKTYYYSGGHFFAFNDKSERYVAISVGKAGLRKMKKRRRLAARRMSRRPVRFRGYRPFLRKP
jgi:Family of unknown function (DUF6515)